MILLKDVDNNNDDDVDDDNMNDVVVVIVIVRSNKNTSSNTNDNGNDKPCTTKRLAFNFMTFWFVSLIAIVSLILAVVTSSLIRSVIKGVLYITLHFSP